LLVIIARGSVAADVAVVYICCADGGVDCGCRISAAEGTKPVQLDKNFLANLFDLDEADITSIDGLTFDLAGGTEDLTFRDLLWERHKTKMEALADVLRSEDDLGKVVRGHIHIEHELQQIIFFAAPNPDHLKSFESQEFAEKVRLALVLGLKADLAPPLNAAGKLRNKFAHKLDMKLSRDVANNLVATLPPLAKERFDSYFSYAMSQLATPFDLLKGESRINAEAQIKVLTFFLCLFDALAHERHRFAVEKIKRMQATAAQAAP
jgi:hypothetical protein